MRFTSNTKTLSDALAKAFSATGTKTPLDIVKNIKAVVSGDTLTLEGTDTEVSIRVSIQVEGKEDGEFILHPNAQSICRESTTETISVESNGSNIQFISGFSSWSLETMDAGTFPVFPAVSGQTVTVKSEILDRAISQVSFSCDSSSTGTRGLVLSGVYIHNRGKGFGMAATDGRKMAFCHVASEKEPEEFSAIVPLKGIALAQKNLPEGMVDIVVSKNSVSFKSGNIEITSRLIEGRFPNYLQIIPDKFESHCSVVCKSLRTVFKQAMITVNPETFGVGVVMKDNNCTVTSKAATLGKSNASCPCSTDGVLDVRLNPQFVLDFLRRVGDTETVYVKGNGQGNHVYMEDSFGKFLIAPMEG